eukprot:gene1681-1952_t
MVVSLNAKRNHSEHFSKLVWNVCAFNLDNLSLENHRIGHKFDLQEENEMSGLHKWVNQQAAGYTLCIGGTRRPSSTLRIRQNCFRRVW